MSSCAPHTSTLSNNPSQSWRSCNLGTLPSPRRAAKASVVPHSLGVMCNMVYVYARPNTQCLVFYTMLLFTSEPKDKNGNHNGSR